MTKSVWRKRAKITGLVLCVLMLALWVFSVMFGAYYVPPRGQWSISMINMGSGQIFFIAGRVPDAGPSRWACFRMYPGWKDLLAKMPWTEFAYTFLGFRLPGKVRKPFGGVRIPVWLLVVAVGLPTAFLWWRDRRREPGHCQECDYDLTGNESGVCSECGTKATET